MKKLLIALGFLLGCSKAAEPAADVAQNSEIVDTADALDAAVDATPADATATDAAADATALADAATDA